MSNELQNLANVRPWGTILLGTKVRCDGEGMGNELDRRITCFSHIHHDHIKGFESALTQSDAIITTTKTKDLLLALKGNWLKKWEQKLVSVEYGEPFELKDSNEKVILYDSNHILGSCQVLVESEGKRILYSSDFNVPGATVVKDIDVLVLDSTHGDPTYGDETKTRQDMVDKIIDLVKEEVDSLRPVIIRSARGRMQDLMYILRKKIEEHFPFITSNDDTKLCQVYAQYGKPSGKIIPAETEEFDRILKRGDPYVRFLTLGGPLLPCEEIGVRSIRVGQRPEYEIKQTNMFQINLSDHSSFDGIMEYVRQNSPRRVITDNSSRSGDLSPTILAAEIKNKLNIEAEPLPKFKRGK